MIKRDRTMKANVKEMSFAELNAMMEVIATEIENRKEQAVSNYKQALAQLAEMGIDPNTITIDQMITTESEAEELTTTEDSTYDTTYETNDEIVATEPATDEDSDTCAESGEPENTKPCTKTCRNRLLKPFYRIWEELSDTKKKPTKKVKTKSVGTSKKHPAKKDAIVDDVPKTKRRVNKLLTPFYKLFTDKPIKKQLRLGNLKYKKNYPDPEEARIVSADGISPTLTATCSYLYIWIPPRLAAA